ADGHPDVLQRARAFDVGQHGGRAGGDVDRRRDLPALAERTGWRGAGALGRAAALAGRAGEVLRTDRTGFRVRKAGQVSEMQPEPVESSHSMSSFEPAPPAGP